MFKKNLLSDSLGSSLFIFVFYAFAHLVTNIETKLNSSSVFILIFSINLIVNLLKKKLDLSHSKLNYVLIYGCISFGLVMFIISFDFITTPIFLSFLLFIVSGIVFSLILYKVTHNKISNI